MERPLSGPCRPMEHVHVANIALQLLLLLVLKSRCLPPSRLIGGDVVQFVQFDTKSDAQQSLAQPATTSRQRPAPVRGRYSIHVPVPAFSSTCG